MFKLSALHRRAAISAAGLLAAARIPADEPPVAPRITALTPLVVPQGFAGTVRLRGSNLKAATGVTTPAGTLPSKLEIKERKDVAAPAGLDVKQAGDSEVLIELALTPDFPVGPLPLTTVVGEQRAEPVTLLVRAAADMIAEAEPNNGFRGAMAIEPGRLIAGTINGPHDVDVFQFAAEVGKKLRITVTASGATSLLDPLLTIYDAGGNWVAGQDDAGASRDAALEFSPAIGGTIFIVLQDALDGGSEGHSYFLELGITP